MEISNMLIRLTHAESLHENRLIYSNRVVNYLYSRNYALYIHSRIRS